MPSYKLRIENYLTRLPVRLLLLAFGSISSFSNVQADASGTIVFTQRFDGVPAIVAEVGWSYVRATPSLTFGPSRTIWTGAGVTEGTAGSDGLFYTPSGDLMVANWETSPNPNRFWKFDPFKTDVVVEGPSEGAFGFHMLLHPNEEDFLATPALGGIACSDGSGPRGCFGAYDHTPLTTTQLCLAPKESATQDILQPVSFIADENLNMFALFNEGVDVEFGGAGFASFDLDTTTSTACSNSMTMTRLIPVGLEAGHSMSWDPFLSDANDGGDPHSDFIIFADSKVSQIRVDDPGTPGAGAALVSTVDMATEAVCDSLLPAGLHEFDQGAVNGEGIALVGDEQNGYLALIDYSQNTNGQLLDGVNTVCLTAYLSDGIDDIAPLTGLGARPGGASFIFKDSFEGEDK